MTLDLEISVSGIKCSGDWSSIVKHGEMISEALKSTSIDAEKQLSEWDRWKPEHGENTNDIEKRTAEMTSIDKNSREKNGIGIGDEIKRLRYKLDKYSSIKNILIISLDHTRLATDTIIRTGTRRLEKLVYKNIMTTLSPCYFDNKMFSANIHESSLISDNEEYTLEVKIENDEIMNSVRSYLRQSQDVNLIKC